MVASAGCAERSLLCVVVAGGDGVGATNRREPPSRADGRERRRVSVA